MSHDMRKLMEAVDEKQYDQVLWDAMDKSTQLAKANKKIKMLQASLKYAYHEGWDSGFIYGKNWDSRDIDSDDARDNDWYHSDTAHKYNATADMDSLANQSHKDLGM